MTGNGEEHEEYGKKINQGRKEKRVKELKYTVKNGTNEIDK